jgi:hypothetical protein
MALSDCIECWNTPCICGHEYKNWPERTKIKHAATVLFGTDKHNVTDAKSLVESITEKFLADATK